MYTTARARGKLIETEFLFQSIYISNGEHSNCLNIHYVHIVKQQVNLINMLVLLILIPVICLGSKSLQSISK